MRPSNLTPESSKVKFNLTLFFLFIIAFIAGCTKIQNTTIGGGLIPPVDGVITKDTILDVFAKNSLRDSIRVQTGADHMLGYTNDPIFGKTKAVINVQLKPTSFPLSFEVNKDSLHLDSVVLVMSYLGAVGDTTQNLGLRVFEIANSSPFKVDSLYYLSSDKFEAGTELTEANTPKMVDPRRLRDSLHLFKEDAANQVRIRLNNAFGQKLLNTFDSNNAYKSDSAFNLAFKGFQIAPDATGNSLLRINLLDTNTKLALYYKYDKRGEAGKQDTTVRYFRTNTYTSATSNYIARDRSGTPTANIPSGAQQDDPIYLQTGPGFQATLQIPELTNFPNVMVHRAELLMDQLPDESSNSDKYFMPPNLFLAGMGDSARPFALKDFPYSSSGTDMGTLAAFGTFPTSKVDANGKTVYSYNFGITAYVQDILTIKAKNYPLILFAPYNDYINPVQATTIRYPIAQSLLNLPANGRVRLAGGSNLNKEKRIRLHIIYSLTK